MMDNYGIDLDNQVVHRVSCRRYAQARIRRRFLGTFPNPFQAVRAAWDALFWNADICPNCDYL